MAASTTGTPNVLIGFSLLPSLLLHSWFFPLQAFAAETHRVSERTHHHATRVSSLLPPSVCNSPFTAEGLEVVDKHGPCSHMSKDKAGPPTLAQILARDQLRVDSIHSILSKHKTLSDSRATTPVVSGRPMGTGNFIINVGLGTPRQNLTLAIDTGSGLTWTQCRPCADRGCYQQDDPIFDPSKSGSYKVVPCTSTVCSVDAANATTYLPGCSGGTCTYGLQYGDGSTSLGFLAVEKLSLTAADSAEGFVFGCGQKNNGLYGTTAGLLGLSQDKVSLVSQTADTFGRLFAYCLPTPGSVGSLTFGPRGGGHSSNVMYTPLSASRSDRDQGFYYLDLTGIDVGGTAVPMPAGKLSFKDTIIDSGTVITRLPPAAYKALRSAFEKQMSNYTQTESFGILDLCYDFSKFDTVTFPTVKLNFKGGAAVAVAALGTITGPGVEQLCLAFAGNRAEDDVAIIGNLQQITYDVVYDVGHRRVGFGAEGCN